MFVPSGPFNYLIVGAVLDSFLTWPVRIGSTVSAQAGLHGVDKSMIV